MLEDERETPLDRVLVHQVKLQRIADAAPSSMLTDMELSGQTKLVRDFQTRALLSKLEEVKQSLPLDLPDDCKHSSVGFAFDTVLTYSSGYDLPFPCNRYGRGNQ